MTRLQIKPYLFATLTSLGLQLATTAGAQPLNADWLYLSGNGSWVARSETLLNSRSQLTLPIENLRADQFWWQAENPQTQLVWQQADPAHLPPRGGTVEIAGESGLWLVQDVNASHLVLQQGKSVRYWPQSQWHLLTWNQSGDFGLSLTVLQPENGKNQLFYAWQEPELSAQVRYRLHSEGGKGTLYQELIVSNLTDSTIQAQGYSYAQQQQAPIVAMRAMSMAAESDMLDVPQSGQSSGVPTLVSAQPVELAANSHAWLPVQQTPLAAVERRYSLTWDTRHTGQQMAQAELQLTAQDTLPDLSGMVKIGIFDQQVALQESFYQAAGEKTAQLSLGQSALVGVTSTLVKEGRWQLDVSNRSQQDAELEIVVQHRQGNSLQRLPLTIRLAAESHQLVQLQQNNRGEISLVK